MIRFGSRWAVSRGRWSSMERSRPWTSFQKRNFPHFLVVPCSKQAPPPQACWGSESLTPLPHRPAQHRNPRHGPRIPGSSPTGGGVTGASVFSSPTISPPVGVRGVAVTAIVAAATTPPSTATARTAKAIGAGARNASACGTAAFTTRAVAVPEVDIPSRAVAITTWALAFHRTESSRAGGGVGSATASVTRKTTVGVRPATVTITEVAAPTTFRTSDSSAPITNS